MHTTSITLLGKLREPNAPEWPEAWRRFVQLYAPLIYDWLRRKGLQDSDAQDLTQNVFLQLHKELPKFDYRPGGSFRSWLLTVTCNCYRMWRRKRKESVGGEDQFAAEPDDHDDLAALIDGEYADWLLKRAVEIMKSDFDEKSWKACMGLLNGRPGAEIAAELGMTVGAVYAAKLRVVLRVREELKELDE